MRNSSNMVLPPFFGSILPDRVHIVPLNLRVRSRQCIRYRLEQDFLQLVNVSLLPSVVLAVNSFIARRTVLVQHPMLD
ncbi:hypothetical protein E2C01_034695 [Portunus trituberculatus]|uniref:Uncharacterized protein n=1 Tax=Portunus trituberculatus TaxID=210409 RepID=A0A5B7F275_PORTR|nr:hypothetical protein [Portunus trituberculatus]